MYDELIKRLRDDNACVSLTTLHEAADAIEELSKPCWISISERLPEEKTYVLILADTIAGKMAKVSFRYKDSAGNNCWTALDAYGKNLFDWQPTHWLPLPQPPKEET